MTDWWTTTITDGTWRSGRKADLSWDVLRGAPMVSLAEQASVFSSRSKLPGALPLVRPGDVSFWTGRVEPKDFAMGHEGLRLGEDLQIGDVLVPRAGPGPAVLVGQAHQAVAFTSGFHVVRAYVATDAVWLWAVLTSRSGERARADLQSGAAFGQLPVQALRALVVPRVAGDQLFPEQLLPDPAVALDALDERLSKWHFAALEGGRWRWNPPDLKENSGERIGDFAQVRLGRSDPDIARAAPGQQQVPLLEAAHVRGKDPPIPLWVSGDNVDLASERTILLSRVAPMHVMVAPSGVAIARGVVRIDIDRAGDELAALARFLGSLGGSHWLARQAVGVTLPQLGVKALAEAPLPIGWRNTSVSEAPRILLSDRIEEALSSRRSS